MTKSERFGVIGAAARPYAPQYFQTVAAALMERRRLNIRYRAPVPDHYRDNRHLDAWCHPQMAYSGAPERLMDILKYGQDGVATEPTAWRQFVVKSIQRRYGDE